MTQPKWRTPWLHESTCSQEISSRYILNTTETCPHKSSQKNAYRKIIPKSHMPENVYIIQPWNGANWFHMLCHGWTLIYATWKKNSCIYHIYTIPNLYSVLWSQFLITKTLLLGGRMKVHNIWEAKGSQKSHRELAHGYTSSQTLLDGRESWTS